MNNDKLLTIIVPTYNMEAYLDRCLSSLLIEDDALMQQIEVLVIDDGSTDGSLSIAQCFAAKYPNSIRAIHKQNGHYGSCINRGLAEATGRYVKVLDADDWYDTAKFVSLLRLLGQTTADAILSDYDQRDDAGRLLIHVTMPVEAEKVLPLETMSDEAMRSVMMHNLTLRTDMIRDIGYHQSEGICYTDQEWVFLPMAQAQTIFYLPEAVYQYLVGRPGQTIQPDVWDRNFWQELQGMCVMINDYTTWRQCLNATAVRYMEQRLAFRNYAIYQAYFTRFATTRNNALLRDYDLFIQRACPDLWQASDAYKVSGFRYVSKWREAGYPEHVAGLWFWRRCGKVSSWVKKHFNF